MKIGPVTTYLEKDGALNLNFLQVPDLGQLEGWQDIATDVRSLDLQGNRLTSLASIPTLPNLERLNVRANRLTTIAGLDRFPKLK